MSRKTFTLSDELHDYVLDISFRDTALLAQLRQETSAHPLSRMQISPEQGQFMDVLLRAMNAKKVIEIGVFTGYSSLVMARALPEDGKILACDIDEETTKVARRYWQEAGVAHKIDLRIGEAEETLGKLIGENRSGEYDFAFIDADKEKYETYFEQVLTLIRPGGLIAIDNTLWSGSVVDETIQDADTVAIRKLNRSLHGDDRVHLSLVPIGDGLTLALKKK